MPKQMISFEEFSGIYNLMVEIPLKQDESDNSYFKRIQSCGTVRSRRTLQLIKRAKEDTDSPKAAYSLYKELSRERKHPKNESIQQEMDLGGYEQAEDTPHRKLRYVIEIYEY